MTQYFSDIAPKILSQALITLRENSIMPRLVNADYAIEAAEKGAVINVPVPSKLQVQDVVPGAYSQNVSDMQLDTVSIPLSNWKESAFYLTDRDIFETMGGVENMQIKEAARALANAVDNSLLALSVGLYNYAGTAGRTPFTDGSGNPTTIKDALDARAILNKNNALLSDRRVVLGVDAEAAALNLAAFQQYLQSGSTETISEAQIGRKVGMDWFLDQNIPTFTAGNFASGTVKTTANWQATVSTDANNPALRNPRSVYSVAVDSAGNAATAKLGDVFTVAGDTQTYVVTADVTSAASGTASAQTATISFKPAPKAAWTVGSILTFKGSRVNNLVFHRDTFALAVRPLGESQLKDVGSSQFMTMVDPVSNIPLRLEVRQEYKRIRWSLDCLWGVGLIRPETGCILAG